MYKIGFSLFAAFMAVAAIIPNLKTSPAVLEGKIYRAEKYGTYCNEILTETHLVEFYNGSRYELINGTGRNFKTFRSGMVYRFEIRPTDNPRYFVFSKVSRQEETDPNVLGMENKLVSKLTKE